MRGLKIWKRARVEAGVKPFSAERGCLTRSGFARPDGMKFFQHWLDWPRAAAGTAALRDGRLLPHRCSAARESERQD
jgi:hypothetical protein